MFTEKDVMRFVEENDVKFVRLSFCDLTGAVKNVSVIASELASAFKTGVKIDARAIDGFADMGEDELVLIPDPTTLSMLPWRPRASGVIRLFCDIVRTDRAPFEGDGRRLLENATKELKALGADCVIGTDSRFYLFETDDKGSPTHTTLDDAGYLDVAPLDKGEDIRRDICLTLDSLGMEPTTSHHEKGPGQNEIDFKHSEAIAAADNYLVYKLLVKAIAARNGTYATFIPRPVEGAPENSLNLDLRPTGGREIKERFAAGIINRLSETGMIMHPFADAMNAEIKAVKDGDAIKLYGIDPTANPYIVFALLIKAGIEGIKNKETSAESATHKVTDFYSATESAKTSGFVTQALPKEALQAYIATLTAARKGYEQAEDKEKFINKNYFERM